ncbi:iap-3 [Trichoplusia ni granulovirus LBIV-12]|jgi:baculoviral IAP repeat-containing protein 7/8|uniref:Iap-3 n=1 Tax=Trichoplusia ni granulovirus LBIV-12 TaxID=1916701 RepID=A0A1D8QLE0_GVTN|nr:iap-3 [Trichoplusia ni granulovirus LBIV-12]AOW41471.1 iap-3 [Trichoplusia ni granulovirus LBIV-12]
MKSYQERIASFANVWCHTNNRMLSPERLSLLGFYYTGYSDKIKCAYCALTLERFICGNSTFDPLVDHKRASPECKFIYENLQSPTNYANTSLVTQNVDDFLNLDLSKMEDRLKTFKHWPTVLQHLSFEMCLSGLYYSKIGDIVVCYVCRERICNWWPDHSPWQRHYYQNSKCPHIVINFYKIQPSYQHQDNGANKHNTATAPSSNNYCSDKLSSAPQLNLIQHESHWRLPQCVKCRLSFIECMFVPCHHLCVCSECAVSTVECPVCESYVSGTVKVNIPVRHLSTNEVQI